MPQANLDDFADVGKEKTRPNGFVVENGHIVHPLLVPGKVGYRRFQVDIADKCIGKNALVVLPTGLGKTIIALLIAVETLHEQNKKEAPVDLFCEQEEALLPAGEKDGKILFVAPTRPLVMQHYDTFNGFMRKGKNMAMVSGKVRPKEREDIYKDADIVFSTPQCVVNDLEKERFPAENVDLLIVDEAHRTVGDYSYVKICDSMECPILGITASPGGKKKKILEVMENLNVETVEARTRRDPDVAEYVEEIKVDWIKVKLNTEMENIRSLLDSYMEEKIKKLQDVGILTYKKPHNVSKTDILGARKQITTKFRRYKGTMFGAIHNQSLAVYAFHCLETLETQGIEQLKYYIERMTQQDDLSKSKRSFIKDERIQRTLELATEYMGISHPKLDVLDELIRKEVEGDPNCRLIVFTQLRDTIPTIMEIIKKTVASGRRFVGQASKSEGKGLKQEEQKKILDDFRDKKFNVLVATSVAEEGLDIPDVDTVIFYEPLPSEIRNIQRRGRTGRTSFGKVKVLIAEDSRDEAYLWAGVAREKKMRSFIHWMEAMN